MEKVPKITLNDGNKMPIIGLGVFLAPPEETKKSVLEAIKIGYRLFDTSECYNNEEALGEAIKESGIPREELFITTKIVPNNKNVSNQIEERLKKLQLNYIDLLLIHWPGENDLEAYKTMEKYVQKGKIKSIGLSNFYGKYLDNILNNCKIKPAISQIETHILKQNKKIREDYKKKNIQIESWGPLGKGQNLNNEILINMGKKYNKSVAQISLRFLIQENIIVIPKSVKSHRIKENFDVFDFNINDDDMEIIRNMDIDKGCIEAWFPKD